MARYFLIGALTLMQDCAAQSSDFDSGIHVVVNAIHLMANLEVPVEFCMQSWKLVCVAILCYNCNHFVMEYLTTEWVISNNQPTIEERVTTISDALRQVKSVLAGRNPCLRFFGY